MKATISKNNAKLFNPVFKTILGGKQTGVSLKNFLENPRKYVNSGIGYLYENQKELIAHFAKNKATAKADVLDMTKAKRGTSFNKAKKSEASKEASDMISEQIKRRKRVEERFARNQEAAKAKTGKEQTAAKKTPAEKAKAAAEKANKK